MARVSVVFTAAAVAQRLGVSEDLVRLMAEEMSDEDGCITLRGIDEDDWNPALTHQGIDAVQELIAEFSQLSPNLTPSDPRP